PGNHKPTIRGHGAATDLGGMPFELLCGILRKVQEEQLAVNCNHSSALAVVAQATVPARFGHFFEVKLLGSAPGRGVQQLEVSILFHHGEDLAVAREGLCSPPGTSGR